jgi:hypothetical protein
MKEQKKTELWNFAESRFGKDRPCPKPEETLSVFKNGVILQTGNEILGIIKCGK